MSQSPDLLSERIAAVLDQKFKQAALEIDALLREHFAGSQPGAPIRWLGYPLQIGTRRINSPFGVDRGAYIHEGLDFFAPLNTPVLAVADGVVRKLYTGKYYGNCVVTGHQRAGKNYQVYSAHLSRWAAPPVGTRIERGDVIGYSGNTGNSTAPHYHLTLVEVGNPTRLKGISLLGCIDPLPLGIDWPQP